MMANLTEISFNSDQFGLVFIFCMFMYFFWVGYASEKRSGGFLMAFSGSIFLYLETIAISYVDAVFVLPFMTPIGIFIIIIGIKKFLYSDTKDLKNRD
jgi:hypothetical protein